MKILVTGGTFDKDYNLITGELYFKASHLKEMLEVGRCTLDLKFETLMLKDSLDLTDSDRGTILEACRTTLESRIVITHGTDTMVVTADYLARARLEKTIVLTGAMIPYKFGMSSDGFFNLGAALAFAQALPSGVYIAMNGRVFPHDGVQKNRQSGFFEPIA